jgi:hypothetical protein
VDALVREGVRTGYAGFWVAPKYTFLGDGRFVLTGELGPAVSWVYPPHSIRVRESGPDAYLVDEGPLADAFAARLHALGCGHRRTDVSGLAIFHALCRKVSLDEVSGYDQGEGGPPAEAEEPAQEG